MSAESILLGIFPMYPLIQVRLDAPDGGLGDVAEGLQTQYQWQSVPLARDARPYLPIAQTLARLA